MKTINKLFLLSIILLTSCAAGQTQVGGKRKNVRRNQVDVIKSAHGQQNWLFGTKGQVPCSEHW
jgi:hypothetical protein